MVTLIADVEADALLPGLTKLWCVGIADATDGVVTLYADRPGYQPMSKGIERLHAADRVVMHNGLGYDFWAVNRFYPGTLRMEQVWDTLVVSRLLDAESRKHKLSEWGLFFGYPKGDHSDFSCFSEEMATYCVRDVEITLKLYRHFQALLKQNYAAGTDWRRALSLEFQTAFIIAMQEQHGFRLDLKACAMLEAELRQEHVEIEREMQRVFLPQWQPTDGRWDWENRRWKDEPFVPKKDNKKMGYVGEAPLNKVEFAAFNPGSRVNIVQRLTASHDWKPRKFTETGFPQVDESVLADLSYPEAKTLNRYFRIQKQLGQVADGDNAWLKLHRDGRIHGAVNTIGAVTGRMSHFAPNVAQVDKKDLRMRAVWLPDEGHNLVGCDAEGLELRMLGHYLAQYDGGEFNLSVTDGKKEDKTDVHSRNQAIAGLYSRDSAKTLIYALLYGAGDGKLGAIVKEDAAAAGHPMRGSNSAVGKAVRVKLMVGIKGFDKLLTKVKAHARAKKWLPGMDGRRVMVRSEHAALNTLLQSAGAIVMKQALVLFHFETTAHMRAAPDMSAPYEYCANVHDEVQLSVEPEYADEIGKAFADSIRLAGEKLKCRCPLAGSYAIGNNWKETH